ncbi:MAG: chemotaxis protein CheZ [Rhodoferax sp.]|jgi:chemotaxis protein CheZ
MQSTHPTPAASPVVPPDVHQTIGLLTRQLHDALNGLGMTDRVKGLAGEIPDAKNRLTYIARLTGEAAEKVLNRVDQAKAQQDALAQEARRIEALIIADPVAAVAKGHVMNFVGDVEHSTHQVDQLLTDIMMAQDFHDLTGQVIAKVVNLAANIEDQLVQLLIQTAPVETAIKGPAPAAALVVPVLAADYQPSLAGPVIDPTGNPDVVSGQSEVDDLLASLGF